MLTRVLVSAFGAGLCNYVIWDAYYDSTGTSDFRKSLLLLNIFSAIVFIAICVLALKIGGDINGVYIPNAQ